MNQPPKDPAIPQPPRKYIPQPLKPRIKTKVLHEILLYSKIIRPEIRSQYQTILRKYDFWTRFSSFVFMSYFVNFVFVKEKWFRMTTTPRTIMFRALPWLIVNLQLGLSRGYLSIRPFVSYRNYFIENIDAIAQQLKLDQDTSKNIAYFLQQKPNVYQNPNSPWKQNPNQPNQPRPNYLASPPSNPSSPTNPNSFTTINSNQNPSPDSTTGINNEYGYSNWREPVKGNEYSSGFKY